MTVIWQSLFKLLSGVPQSSQVQVQSLIDLLNGMPLSPQVQS